MEENTVFEPTLFEAAKRFWILVVIIALVFATLAFLGARFLLSGWDAGSSVLIEDPAASQVFDTATVAQPARYLTSQAAILESPDMAESVQSLVSDPDSPTINEIMGDRDIVTSSDTDLIQISFNGRTPVLAITYANAFGEAYLAYRERVTASSFEAAVAGLDESINAVDSELAAIDKDIEALASVPGTSDLERQLEDAISEFLSGAPDSESAALLENVLEQLQTLQVIRSLESQNPNLAILLETRRGVSDRRSQLVVRRDQLQVDAALASTGVVAFSEAIEAEPAVSASRVSAFGLILGALVGVGVAYSLAVRSRRFGHRTEPEMVLNIPMLAEVPKFGGIGAVELLPVLNHPSSPAAESFRFASNAIVARMEQLQVQHGSSKRSIVVTSALLGDGKTVLTVNTGLSMATRGKMVLIIDGDFGDPALSRMLVGDTVNHKGITDIVEAQANLGDVVVPVSLGQGHHVDVLTRGTIEISASDFFNSAETKVLFDLFKNRYDYILIDAPPLLQVSYATSVVSLADGVVAVIPHEGRVSIQQELANRLDLIGVDGVGYIYNKAPKRPEMQERRGSMRDPLGTGQEPSA